MLLRTKSIKNRQAELVLNSLAKLQPVQSVSEKRCDTQKSSQSVEYRLHAITLSLRNARENSNICSTCDLVLQIDLLDLHDSMSSCSL